MMDKFTQKDIYSSLWKCRDLEIQMLWSRLTLVGTFMALTYAGYGALILKCLDGIKCWKVFNLVAVGASVFGLLFSIIWTATAKGSKAWFERYEALLSYFQETYKEHDLCEKVEDEELVLSYLDYNKRAILRRTPAIDSNLMSPNAGAFSVSKIPIVMGQVSLIAWCAIGLLHMFMLLFDKRNAFSLIQENAFAMALVILMVAVVVGFLVHSSIGSSALKGE